MLNDSTKTPALLPTREELKPCPWPHPVQAVTIDGPPYLHRRNSYRVICKVCGTTPGIFDSEAEAITAWNTRHSPAPAKGRERIPYSHAIGEAGQAYIKKVSPNGDAALGGNFYYTNLWDAMQAAALASPAAPTPQAAEPDTCGYMEWADEGEKGDA